VQHDSTQRRHRAGDAEDKQLVFARPDQLRDGRHQSDHTAPASSDTMIAGNTQQTRVAELVNNAAADAPRVRFSVIVIATP
jgi:hypothetical protein